MKIKAVKKEQIELKNICSIEHVRYKMDNYIQHSTASSSITHLPF